MRALVLTYHSQNINGREYANNDQVALRSDLETLIRRELRLVSARSVALAVRGELRLDEPVVALTCDDGTSLDWEPFEHPMHGLQPSFRQILSEAVREGLRAPRRGLMTAFVIASPEAHAVIDAYNHGGYRITRDDWWANAAAEGLFELGCHSWDHCAVGIDPERLQASRVGTFHGVETARHADQQVRVASERIRAVAGDEEQARLFAYPYGEAAEFVVRDYLPVAPHGLLAAFTDAARPIDAATSRWTIPRYVCGAHWSKPTEFAQMIDDWLMDRSAR